jgi:hypothetical protein
MVTVAMCLLHAEFRNSYCSIVPKTPKTYRSAKYVAIACCNGLVLLSVGSGQA